MRKQLKRTVYIFLFFQLITVATVADARNLFRQGSISASIILGSGQALNQDYSIFGVGFKNYIFDGFSLGLEYETWTGAEPSINKLSPQAQYVFNRNGSVNPYTGFFFTRATVSGQEDIDSYGGKIGAYFDAGTDIYLGIGLVFEQYADCNESVFVTCTDTYPEFILSIAL